MLRILSNPSAIHKNLKAWDTPASRTRALDGDAGFIPAIEAGICSDRGDGETGTGVEVGAILRYVDAKSGVTMDIRGCTLLAHTGNYKETGDSGFARPDPGASGRGMSLSLRPSWGNVSSGVDRLWEYGAAELAANDNPNQVRVQATAGYGLGVLNRHGVLSPYSGLSLSGEGLESCDPGVCCTVESIFELNLEGDHNKQAHGAIDNGIMLRSSLNW